MRDRSIYRRKLAYPLLTLAVAGGVFLFSRGHIGTAPPAKPDDYATFAREVLAEVRAGKPMPRTVDPAIERVFDMLAPPSVRDPAGGALTFELAGPVAAAVGLPHVQTVVVRAPDGAGVGLSISILGGVAEVVGVSSVDPTAPAAAAEASP